MVKQQPALDDVFGALSHEVRRQTIDALRLGAHTTSELAAPHAMSLAGFMKHLRVLSDVGLVCCVKDGRTVTCTLTVKPLSQALNWLSNREQILNARLDALGRHLYHREQIAADRADQPLVAKKRSPPT